MASESLSAGTPGEDHGCYPWVAVPPIVVPEVPVIVWGGARGSGSGDAQALCAGI